MTDLPEGPLDPDPLDSESVAEASAVADEPMSFDALVVDGAPSVDKPKKKKGKKRKVVVKEVIPAWVRWAAAAAALVLVAVSALAFGQMRRADDAVGSADDRTAAARVAGEFTETLFTFDGANPTASLDRLKQLATTAYQPKVDDARQTALAGGGDAATDATMAANVTDVYLTELSGDDAHAVTRADWVLKAGGQTLTLDLYLRIDLKQVKGKWKVDAVTALTAKQPPGATPTTTAPASDSTTPTSGG